jgi:hypothetical protein
MFRSLRWALIPIVAAHNFEEWLTFPIYGGPPVPWPAVQLALILVTLAPALVILWAVSGSQGKRKDFATLWIAGIFAANALLQHIPGAIVARGYSPGVLTAVTINLPFAFLLYRAALREQRATVRSATLALVFGALSLPLAILGALAIANMLMQQLATAP